jgi:type II secretory pathway pseudopilin PulG
MVPAFTLLEILVVVAIFVLLTAVGVPAFRSLILNAERSLAENQLKAGLAAGRDAAIRSEQGDAAAVFFYTPGGKVRIVPCVSVGKFMDVGVGLVTAPNDARRANPLNQFEREIFVPVAGLRPVELPKSWSVRGFTPPGTLHVGAPATVAIPAILRNGWYPTAGSPTITGAAGADPDRRLKGNWMFPETGMLLLRDRSGNPITDLRVINAQGPTRQTFMVRFKARTGDLDLSNLTPVVVLDPIDNPEYRKARIADLSGTATSQTARLMDPSVATDKVEWVRRVLSMSRPSDLGLKAGISIDAFRQLMLGSESIDTVVAGPVSQLSFYGERQFLRALSRANPMGKNPFLAEMVSPGLNSVGSIYQDPTDWDPSQLTAVNSFYYFPKVDPAVFPSASDLTQIRGRVLLGFELWMLGRLESRTKDSDGNAQYETTDAKIFVMQRSLGQVQEVKP